jgi:hypothetical protein
MLLDSQIKKLGDLLGLHSQVYPKLPVKAEQFESLFSSATESVWTPNNHNPNEDMITEVHSMIRPSLKSGVIKNGYLTISSHRTTSYKTLQEKLDFLSSRTYDSYVCLSRRDGEKIHKYQLIYFPKNIINFNSLTWVDTYNKKGEKSGWEGINQDKSIEVKIVKSMSHQVWIKIDINLITVLAEYDITK